MPSQDMLKNTGIPSTVSALEEWRAGVDRKRAETLERIAARNKADIADLEANKADDVGAEGGDRRMHGPASIVVSDSVSFSGTAYAPNGHPTTGLDADSAKLWVKFDKITFEFTEEVGPPSDPFPADEYWFRKAGVSGDARMFM